MERRGARKLVTETVSTIQPRLQIETDSGLQITCSVSHEFMMHGRNSAVLVGEPMPAACLRISDQFEAADGVHVGIRSIARVEDGPVVQISLAGPGHVYLAGGIWSHNKQQAWP